VAYRCIVCSIRALEKKVGDPYYEPTIVVHDNHEDGLEIQLWIKSK